MYTLDGNEEHAQLLRFVLSKETLADTMVIINVDLSHAWDMLAVIERWVKVLQTHLDSLEAPELLQELRAKSTRRDGPRRRPARQHVPFTTDPPCGCVGPGRAAAAAAAPSLPPLPPPFAAAHSSRTACCLCAVVRYFQTRMEGALADMDAPATGETEEGAEGAEGEEGEAGESLAEAEAEAEAAAEAEEDAGPKEIADEELLDLEEGVLTTNVGLPILIVVNKSDCVPLLQRDRDYRNEHFDFIQLNLRTVALRHGAALVYTSKDGKNQQTLYDYLLHRAYGLPFGAPADIANNDSVFVPTGWDNSTHIAVLHDGLKSIGPEDPFGDHIKAPTVANSGEVEEIKAEDEQEFLKKQKTAVGASGGSATIVERAATRKSTRLAAQSSSSSTTTTTSTTTSSGGKDAAGAGGKAGEDASTDVLANFFTSLLKKKPGTGKERQDAAAELDRRK